MLRWHLHLHLIFLLDSNTIFCQKDKFPSQKHFRKIETCQKSDITVLTNKISSYLNFPNPSNQFSCWKRPRDEKLLSGTILNKDSSPDLFNRIQSQKTILRSLNDNKITLNFECEYKDTTTGKHYYLWECIPPRHKLANVHIYYHPKYRNLDLIWVTICGAIARVMEKLIKKQFYNVNLDLKNWALLPNTDTDTEVRVLDLSGARQQSFLSKGLSLVTNLWNKEKRENKENQEVRRLGLMFKELYELLEREQLAEFDHHTPIRHSYKGKVDGLLMLMLTDKQEKRYSLSDVVFVLEGFEQHIRSQRALQLEQIVVISLPKNTHTTLNISQLPIKAQAI